jgi:uncharacterized membrane protein
MFLKKHPKKFFSPVEQEKIVREIIWAEEKTSGEIRVHLDRHAGKDILQKAQSIFFRLGMEKTRHRNGVLIYLATDQRKFAILGDEGIHRVLPEGAWEGIKNAMQKHFHEGQFCEGICLAIRQVGEKLHTHFPAEEGPHDELPNEVTESE